MHPVLAQAIASLTTMASSRPSAPEMVEALLDTEKSARRAKPQLTYSQLIGTWQLQFITGTKRSRQKAGIALGAGRFIPPWLVQIHLQYSGINPNQNQDQSTEQSTKQPTGRSKAEWGQVKNSVSLGPLTLALTGPTRLWPQTNSLAFDFTQMTIQIAGKIVYQGKIRGGTNQAQDFAQQSLKDQAFFTYFLVDDQALAARGRGGGLALWTRCL
ncbi:MAG: hypothetical protein F6K09_14725 [Merismopedia sp. SIO2A8]|nr:hypothetical protein [Symploca sp. SIO2B6]NET49937.1 hypothetical protein [Merismopedia sp. SIO2A8]